MAIPDFSTTGLKDVPLVDTWEVVDPYLDPLQTDMEGGNKRLRTRAGDETAHITFQLLYSLADFETFKNFVLNNLSRGTSRFTMRVWNGSEMVTKTVQFANKFKPATVYPKVNVSMDLWVYGGL